MKRVFISLMCLIAMLVVNTGLKAQEITITLNPGWNWISYPRADTLSFTEAMGSFVPVEGDIIESQYGITEYYFDMGWFGTLEQFYPGWGYLYYSNRTSPVTFTFQLQQSVSPVTITTLEPTDVTASSSIITSMVTIPEGCHVFLRGLCWGTEPNPDINDDHIAGDAIAGSQSYTMDGLTPNTTYYVRSYAVTDYGLAYGDEQSFTPDYVYVDLGLPSGTLWAICNVGASTPEGCGDYFAWGETKPKDIYYWSTYQHANGSSLEDPQYIKYCNNPEFGFNGFTDNLTKLLPEDDAATANWGENWCIPTGSQFEELFNHTTFTSVVSNGVTGFLFTASNGNSIFLPVTGSLSYDNVIYGNTGQYWSSTLLADPNYVSFLFFYSESFGSNIEMANAVRCYGHPVRPVRSVPQNNTPEGAINGLFTINANGDQVYFSKGNLQYIGSATTPYWKFADNQWDYFGDNGQGSEDLDVDRDLFGWGTSGYHDSDDPYNVNYQPWSTSMTTVNMTNNNYGYGPSINMSSFNLTSTSANYDWGVYNMINNGGNQENLWRTLTYPEWTYIFNSRNTLSDDRYAKANVNGVNGVILLPDNWNSNAFNLENTDSKEASFTSNVLTITQWNILEECGAVFLPAAGGRNRITIHDVDYQGCYWSASSANSANAARLFFYDSDLNPLSTFGRCGGQSVRLVKDYNP